MRIGIYGRENRPCVGALYQGALANGYRPVRRSLSDHATGQLEDFDAIVVYGLRGKGDALVKEYEVAGVPALVLDFGFLKRVNREADFATGHWQLSVGGLNKAPRFDVSADRFDALGIECKSPGNGSVVAVFGQVVGDMSHGYDLEKMRGWARRTVRDLGAHWRPHPLDRLTADYGPRLDGELADLWPKLKRIETLCSTAGLEALIAGVPAVAHLPERAVWGDLSGPAHPGPEKVRDLCQRVAYAQWTSDELASGEGLAFVVENLERWNAERR
ncbi:hypothetical protein [Maritimibacter sp. UBA3975]|uniref:hypothetical protein n=1 Tax=Maritimibacter sp. UBA3975 TaxID=1946833 RepID=UPI000C0BA707|nr:hypothetical protein [Maritimibacter sp. UBA3975]MAM60855.1 hypothetical protein [Maritimibacter sp.]|tara:strand:+ start:10997 stop:11815 length:819 start_codon:yes stop_codon:yes gene_type:complete